MNKRISFACIIYLLISLSAAGQYRYRGGETALGARIGGVTGITFKKFIGRTFAFEFIGAYNYANELRQITFSALAEKHAPLIGDRFSAMIGAGASYLTKDDRYGVNGILGL